VTADVVLSERPAEAEDRAVPGHWESDLIIGLHRSAIRTVVERTSRYTLLVHLPRLEGYGVEPPIKNGPAIGGYGAIAMKNALEATLGSMPAELVRSLSWDRGKELSAHAPFTIDTGIKVFFADPHSPWQRGTNEITNGLLRQYFPKGTDLSRWSRDDILAVQDALNSRPRKVLGWKSTSRVSSRWPGDMADSAATKPSDCAMSWHAAGATTAPRSSKRSGRRSFSPSTVTAGRCRTAGQFWDLSYNESC